MLDRQHQMLSQLLFRGIWVKTEMGGVKKNEVLSKEQRNNECLIKEELQEFGVSLKILCLRWSSRKQRA